MPLPSPSVSRRLHRLRVVAADKAFPGGLAAHRRQSHGIGDGVVLPDGLVLADLAQRTVPVVDYLALNGPLRVELGQVITDEEIATLRPQLTERETHFLDAHDPVAGRTVALALAIHYGLPGVAERAGLSTAMPPQDVHAMYHETWGAGGDIVYSDMIDIALREAGNELQPGQQVLDFGVSSGRVVRMLAGRRPEIRWAGCDVNKDAIDWADGALPGIRFFHQPLRPPLPLEDGELDAAFAISIWSHYDEEPALTWLEEMRRVLKIGGALLITTHGEAAIGARAADPEHGPAGQAPIARQLYRHGFAFFDIFGEAGDWGVVDSGWGTSFLTPEWLMAKITPDWSVRLFRPAGIGRHQDLYVLRRER